MKINRAGNDIFDSVITEIDYSQFAKEISKKVNIQITELSSGNPLLQDEQNKSNEDIIAQFLADYDKVKKIMTTPQLINFYKTVELDIPPDYFKTKEASRNKLIRIDKSQGIIIFNDEYFVYNNRYKYPNFGTANSYNSRTFVITLKPKVVNYRPKYLYRQLIPITVKVREV